MSENVSANGNVASRRAVVGGFVGLGVGVPLLVACGSDSESDDGGGSDSKDDGGSSNGGGTTSSGAIGKKADVPVGSGKIYAGEKVVITQPTEGDFKAFSAVCTHQGCVVAKIAAKEIECTCHGSKFSIEDGSVTAGPADKALESLTVTASGEELSVS